MKSDVPLLDRVQASPRDEKLWTELYRRLHPRVYTLAYRLCQGDSALAEDLTQDAFLRLINYDAFRRLTSELAAIGYLRAILRNNVRDHFRKAHQLPTVSLENVLSPQDARRIEGLIAATFSDEDFAILDGLKAEDQQLLRLVVEGWNLREVAEKIGVTYSAAAVRLHRLRKKLREM